MKLHTDSLHYRLATLYGHGDFDGKTDLCTYTRHMCVGVFFFCCAILLGSIISDFLVLNVLLWLAVSIAEGRLMPMLPMTVAALFVWAITACGIGFALWAAYRSANGKPIIPAPDAVREAYRGWKEKYCPLIELQ